MINFPVDKEQINKHWSKTRCYSAGFSKFRGNERHNTDKIIQTDNMLNQLHTRTLTVGEEVGADLKGPILGMGAYIFVRKASGNVIGRAVKMGKRDKSTSNDTHFIYITSETIIMVHNIYRMYHKLINLISDSHSVHKSRKTRDTCKHFGIQQQIYAPEQHQYNGLAEITVQHLQAMVVSMYCLAAYAPKQLWT